MMPKKDKKTDGDNKRTREAVILLVSLVICSVVVCGIYRTMLELYYFEYILFGYLTAETVMIIAYLIYNRGFSRKGVTAEMLPIDWSEEQKTEFIEDGKRRLRKSRWLLVIILAFLFTFAVDVIELVVIPFIFNMVGI